MDTKQTLPARSIRIKLFENEYDINFPSNGFLIDIEANKVLLSKDTHKSLIFNNTAGSDLAYVTIEAIATFSVLVPKLKEDLMKNLLELSPIDTKPLISAYTKTYYPWFKQWMDIINQEEPVEAK